MKTNMIADRKTIADYFGTDSLTTQRILSNTNWSFFVNFFGDKAKEKWNEAHPFLYPNNSKNYIDFDIRFIEKHFELFSENQLCMSSGWTQNPKTRKMEWSTRCYYKKVK